MSLPSLVSCSVRMDGVCDQVCTCGVPTNQPPTLYQKKTHFVQKAPEKCTKMYPKCIKEKPVCTKEPPIDVARMDPHKSNMQQQQHPLPNNKQQSSPRMLHLWSVVYQKANLVAPFHTKNPQDALPTSKQNTERTLTFSSMTFHSLSYLHA